jgi:hypothetical protein
MRLLTSLLLLFLLSACVLSSKAAKFAASEAASPIASNVEFDGYTKEGEGWKKEEEPFSFKRDGAVYLMSDGKNMSSVLFVQLRPEWFAAQYREGDGPYYYGLIKTTGSELEVSPLPCDKLKPLVSAIPGIAFSGDDCSIDRMPDPKAFFTELIDKIPGPQMKLVPRQ